MPSSSQMGRRRSSWKAWSGQPATMTWSWWWPPPPTTCCCPASGVGWPRCGAAGPVSSSLRLQLQTARCSTCAFHAARAAAGLPAGRFWSCGARPHPSRWPCSTSRLGSVGNRFQHLPPLLRVPATDRPRDRTSPSHGGLSVSVPILASGRTDLGGRLGYRCEVCPFGGLPPGPSLDYRRLTAWSGAGRASERVVDLGPDRRSSARGPG